VQRAVDKRIAREDATLTRFQGVPVTRGRSQL
jgi:hypothetical protein